MQYSWMKVRVYFILFLHSSLRTSRPLTLSFDNVILTVLWWADVTALGPFEWSKTRRRNSLSFVLIVHFEARSPTSAGRDLRRRNRLLRCAEREAVGGQARTDEPYLGRACVRSPSTPACPAALSVCLSVFQLRKSTLVIASKRTIPHISAHGHADAVL